MQAITQNAVNEWSFTTTKTYADPFNEVELDAVFTDQDGRERRVPAFWAGGNVWRVRFSSPTCGAQSFVTVCSDTSNADLHGLRGEFEVTPYTGPNPLYQHGPVRVAADKRHFEHADGTPFLWLADTEWFGLCHRLSWPEDFQTLTNDRARKGFSVIQIVAGPYPDMPLFDERGANEAGYSWETDLSRVNPAYYDMADRRIDYIVSLGIVPCIVGCWGYYLDEMGEDRIRKHWRNLIARYGAYPVIWCAAGEATMPFYTYAGDREAYLERIRTQWTEIVRYIRTTDPCGRLVTIHPTSKGHEQVDDASVLDFDMLQTGHSGHHDLPGTLRTLSAALDHEPKMPVINSEVAYEGILEMNREEIQRLFFWTCVLSGAAGHTYGANGIWQVNRPDKPHGPSPHGSSWGDTPWQVAMNLPGSTNLGVGKRLLERYQWHLFEPHQDWIECWHNGMYVPDAAVQFVPRAAGIPGKVRMIYTSYLLGGLAKVKGIEPGVSYRASYFNPSDGTEVEIGAVTPNESGEWQPPSPPIFRDWVLVLAS